MYEFVLIILATMGLSKDPFTFEIRVPKKKPTKNVLKISKLITFHFKSCIKLNL